MSLEELQKKLIQAKRECDVWKNSKGGKHNYEMSYRLVSSIERQIADLLKKT